MIATEGFYPTTRIPVNTPVRLTITQAGFGLGFDVFPGAAVTIRDSLLPIAGIAPYTPMTVVKGDSATIVEGNLKHETLGADLVNKLAYLDQRFAEVSRVQVLSPAQRANRDTDSGQAEREAAKTSAELTVTADSWLTKLTNAAGTAGTIGKWVIIGVAAVAVIYVAHEFGD